MKYKLQDSILKNIPGAIYRCKNDADWTMLFISEGCVELTGYKPEELLDNATISYNDLILAEDRDLVRLAIDGGINEKRQYQMEYRIQAKDGEIRWILEKGYADYDEEGQVSFLDGYLSDITERKNFEEQLHQMASDLAEQNAIKNHFFSILAHDLQNPIYAIISLSEFMAENHSEVGSEGLTEMFRKIIVSARNLSIRLDNLLDWAKLQTGQIQVQKDLLNVGKLLVSVISQFEEEAGRKEICIEYKDGQSCIISSDFGLLTAIMRNLISNAIKYSQPKGKVLVELKRKEDEVEIAVIDYGMGIPRKHLSEIFRLNNEYRQYGTMNESGSGIGLALVQEFVKLLGAKIAVESKSNQGSRFSLSLPLKFD